MKKYIVLLFFVFSVSQSIFGQGSGANDQRMEWWREARFGMFIHWGIYAIPAGTFRGNKIDHIGEWIMNDGKIPVAEYRQFAQQFNPVLYDPEAWVKAAKDAGMKYIVITAKHHDGFALFDSKANSWNVVDATPFKKDLLTPLADACRRQGIKLGFYYSQAQDWNNPGGAVARRLAGRAWANPDSAIIDAYTKEHEGHWDPAQTTRTMEQYIDSVAIPQVKELLNNYGDVAIIWWDTPTGMTDAYAAKLDAILKAHPQVISNDRLKRPNYPGDYKTPEQRIPNMSELDGKDWETCMTMNETWGYKSYANNWKSTETLVRNLVDIASKGGNYLLNVGPKADGSFPQQSIDLLKGIGVWMKTNGEAVYGTKASPFGLFTWGRCTKKEIEKNTILYFSVFDWPADRKLIIPGLQNHVISATMLAGGAAVKTNRTKDGTVISLPATAIDPIATVIKVNVRGTVASQVVYAKEPIKSGL
ncbi:MAG: alpha-L-fucosidase [Chitinophagaceae bacterium]